MKEGAAVEDFTRPDRVILGTENPAVVEIMRQIYAPFMRKRERIIAMDTASAEMTKYAANALLATRVSFMNEVANLCERYGADIETVRAGVGSDSRIGHEFLFPGSATGGRASRRMSARSSAWARRSATPPTSRWPRRRSTSDSATCSPTG